MRAPATCLALAALLAPALVAAPPPARAQEPQRAPDRFTINAIDVSGATQLPAAEIERLIYPFLGPDRTQDDVIAAQKALQDAYAARGFEAVLVDLPIQPEEYFSRGVVQIAVNETPVGRVRVVGSKYHALSDVRAQVPSLREGAPLNLKALGRDVAAANRYPDRTVDPTFRPGQVPGTIDVDLRVDDTLPFHASAELNNDNSPNTRPLRALGTVRYTDLWGAGHSLSLTGSLAPQDTDQSAVISVSYSAPIAGTPWTLLVYGYSSNSNVAALGGVNVLGNGTQIGLRALYRLPDEALFQQLSFGPDFKAFDEQLSLNGAALRPVPIRYVPLVADYTMSGADETTRFGLTFGVTAGLRAVERVPCIDLNAAQPESAAVCTLPGGGVGVREDQFQGRSIDAEENFVHVNLDADWARTFGNGMILSLRIAAQLADSPLVTNEQFSIGGMTNVRGYYVSEAVGDDGFVNSVELQSPDWAGKLGAPWDELRVFGFGDLGYARVRRASAGQTGSFRLGSFGGGARVRLLDLVTGEFLLGVPVADGPTTRAWNPRYNFSIKGEF